MPCPRCHAEVAEDVDVCPHCQFTLSVLELQLPPPPSQTGHVNDWAGVLSAAASFSRKQPTLTRPRKSTAKLS
jgi:hypothetical protein